MLYLLNITYTYCKKYNERWLMAVFINVMPMRISTLKNKTSIW